MKKIVAVLVMVLMAVGFDWSLSQETNDVVQITVKNQFSYPVSIYVNGTLVCYAKVDSSCTVPVKIGKGPYKLEARGGPSNNVMASEIFDPLPGENMIWETGNIEFPRIPAVANQTSPKGSAVSFMTSVAWLSYQGQKAQNRAQTVSLAKIERQTSSIGATYALSGQGGFRIGKDGTAAFYGMSPITVSRNLSNDRLSSDKKGLNLWLTVINGTLNGLTHKRMVSGAWEEPITLSLGDSFPETIQAQFRAQPLPEPDNKWILIAADSGLISFRALDKKYQDSLIYGRYRGVLVYSPTEDAFLQAAAAFTLYHGEDKFRIEQLHFAADASGNQLNPVLDVGSYLDFKPEAPTIATEGSFPSWCVQATQVLDILHMAIMTAAEGSTNPGAIMTMADQSLLNWICRDTEFTGKILGQDAEAEYLGEMGKLMFRAAGEEYCGNWMKALDFINTQREEGTAKAMYELAKSVGTDIILAPFPQVALFKTIMDIAVPTVLLTLQTKMLGDFSRLTPFFWPAPAPIIQTEPPQPALEPPTGTSLIPIVFGVPVAIGGGLLLGKLLSGAKGWDGTYDTTVYTWTPIGNYTESGTFTVKGGRVSEGTFTGTVEADGTFTGTTRVCQGCLDQRLCGTFDKVKTFVLTTNGNGCLGSEKTGQRITAKKR